MTKKTEEFRYVAREDLYESPMNPRRHFDEEALAQLTESVRASGILEALVVRHNPNGKGQYEIGSGHRRFRAAARAELDRIPVRILELDDTAFLELLQVSNLQRDDLHPLEEAEGYRTLMEKAGYDVAKLAARVGRSTKYVYDRIKLLQLIPKAQELFLAGRFTAGHAILLARLTADQQEELIAPDNWLGLWRDERLPLLNDIVEQQQDAGDDYAGLVPVSVRELEDWIGKHCRIEPTNEDIPMLFPETAGALEEAEAQELKVIAITDERRLSDRVKVKGQRTYGPEHWKRADGSAKDAPECEYAVMGFGAAGLVRGQAFKVCTAKKKCTVHWKAEQQEAKRRAAASAGDTSSQTTWERDQERWRRQREREEAERKRLKQAGPAILKAIAEKVAAAPVTAKGRLLQYLKGRMHLRGTVSGKTAEELLRSLAVAALKSECANDWNMVHALPHAAKTFGVDHKQIMDEVAPAEDKPVRGRPVKKRASRKKAKAS